MIYAIALIFAFSTVGAILVYDMMAKANQGVQDMHEEV